MKQKLVKSESKAGPMGVFTWRKAPEASRLGGIRNHAGVHKSLDFLAKNFAEPIQMEHLVKVSGMSRRGFCNAFNKTVGINPGAALRGMRIEYAKHILLEQDLGLKQIAKLCGYQSENTFCVAFQRSVGISPKKFQRQYWLEIWRVREPSQMRAMIANHLFPATWLGNVRASSRKLYSPVGAH